MTLKVKLTLWFSSLLLLLVAVVIGILFLFGRSVLQADLKERLIGQVEANAEEIEYDNLPEEESFEEGDQFIEYLGGYLGIDDDFCNYYEGVYTALYDRNDTLLYGEMPVILAEKKEPGRVKTVTAGGDRYYVFDKALRGETLDGLWLRGIASVRENSLLVARIFWISVWLLPLFAVAAAGGGYWIAARSLAPAAELNKTVKEINEGTDLSRRVELRKGKDEIHELAVNFNGMFDRLEALFEAERKFTSDASHELRTPVAVILAQCENALEHASGEQDFREALEVIERQGYKMSRLIGRLLEFTRLEQGSAQVQKTWTDMGALTREICEEQEMLGEQGITMRTEIKEPVTAEVDPQLMTRLLENVIRNAYRYGRKNGHICVKLDQSEEEFFLVVADDGIGIAEEELPKIWRRFYQVEGARSPGREAGAGLGLSMVRQIVKLHGGAVEVESRDGEGTEFRFRFPKQDTVKSLLLTKI